MTLNDPFWAEFGHFRYTLHPKQRALASVLYLYCTVAVPLLESLRNNGRFASETAARVLYIIIAFSSPRMGVVIVTV
jgi:hypothetical protein